MTTRASRTAYGQVGVARVEAVCVVERTGWEQDGRGATLVGLTLSLPAPL